MAGYIKLHRQLLQWGWYSDANTFRVFMHLLLMANFEEHEYRGIVLKPGQLITGRKKLARDLKLSERSVRTALEHLKTTNEITIKTTNKFSVITIENWGKYQLCDEETTNKTTNKTSIDRPTTDHIQEGKKYLNNIKDIISSSEEPQSIRSQVIEEWNKLPLGELRAINDGSTRYKLLKARVKQYGLDQVLQAIRSIERSPFLLGQNKHGWTITFDWFVKPNNFPKVLEGNYLDKDATGKERERMSNEEFKAIAAAHEGADEW